MGTTAKDPRTLLLLGSGELGRELAIAAQRLGVRVVAVDRYDGAPAMPLAHVREVVSMLDGTALEGVIRTHRPHLMIPELELIRTEKLVQLEGEGYQVIPTAEAVRLTMDREGIRRLAAEELGLRTPAYLFADSEEELGAACDELGFPCVVKPLTSYSGRGQTTVLGPARVEQAWAYAQDESPGQRSRVVAEEKIDFHTEITLLAVRGGAGELRFLEPIGHRQDRGGYQESWTPCSLPGPLHEEARRVARTLTDRLGGAGVFGLEFFVTETEVIFSELTAGPHDTGFVTLASHDLSQFELHLRAALDLPVPAVRSHGPAASAVILARERGTVREYEGLERALRVEGSRVLLFGKPEAHPLRRMGVALATGRTVEEARARALEAAARVEVRVG